MAQKPVKSPATRPSSSPRQSLKVPVVAPENPRTQADTRWQRTVRFAWDKGGAKGGRR
jgi:hypothetical protein